MVSGTFAQAQTHLDQIINMQTAPKCYGAIKTKDLIKIDGKADEKAWDLAPWTDKFVDIEGDKRASPSFDTKVKMLWDENCLYLYALLEEPHIWGDLTEHDAIIYHNNDFEVFIRPFEQHPLYYEIEINPLNTVMDLFMPKPYRLGGEALMHWDIKNLKAAVYVNGTLNNPNDTDVYWSIEMAIPFSSLTTFGRRPTPRVNDYWKINFSRVQWQHEITEGKYTRREDQGKIMPEDNWVWSPIGIVNMHYPERWGYVQFIDTPKNINLPASYAIEKIAWNIFYLQQLHKKTLGKFATDLKQLKGYEEVLQNDAQERHCSIFTNKRSTSYKMEIKDPTAGITVTLDHFGHYTINYE